MNVVEARKLLKFDKSKYRINRVSETPSFFVFSIIPKNCDENDAPLIPTKSVNKTTGEIGIFNPADASPKELDNLSIIYME